MIKNFTKQALIVFPLYDDYKDRNQHYRDNLNASTLKLVELLHASGINAHFFVTDDVAHEISVLPDDWVSTLNRGDLFFVSRNCVGMQDIDSDLITYDDVYETTAESFEITRDMSIERRFEVTLKRENKARNLILKKYNFLIYIKQSTTPAIRYKPKAGSGVLYLEITNVNFLSKCFMSDMQMDVSEILGVKNGNMPVYEWEVS